MIELIHASFQYENSDRGVQDISLSVKSGECVVLTGLSGCGKTTVTRLVNGLAPSYYPGVFSGSVRIDGKDISRLSTWEIGRLVGSVFQDPKSQFFSSELAGEVAFPCENYGLSAREIRERTDAAIEALHLSHLKDRAVDVLSSGEKQRAAIASVYAMKPKVFVCDEPTANPSPLREETAEPERKGTEAADAYSVYEEIIKDNIEYEHFIKHTNIDRERLDEIVSLILETVCTKRKTIRIAGDDYPAELVKAKFMKLNSSHIEFVFDCMKENTTKIRNIKQYLKAVLFNAPNTIDSYYTALVNHDMYGGY